MSKDLEHQFEGHVRRYCAECKKLNYHPNYLLDMIDDKGGAVKAVQYLFNRPRCSDGFITLWENGRLDLTMEALVIEHPRYHELFTELELETARLWLTEAGYKFQAISVDLKDDFDKHVRRYCAECPSIGYKPTIFLGMVSRHGAIEAVRRLISGDPRKPNEGFLTLWEKGRIDLSMEALVVEYPRYKDFFGELLIDNARKRLELYRYTPEIKD